MAAPRTSPAGSRAGGSATSRTSCSSTLSTSTRIPTTASSSRSSATKWSNRRERRAADSAANLIRDSFYWRSLFAQSFSIFHGTEAKSTYQPTQEISPPSSHQSLFASSLIVPILLIFLLIVVGTDGFQFVRGNNPGLVFSSECTSRAPGLANTFPPCSPAPGPLL